MLKLSKTVADTLGTRTSSRRRTCCTRRCAPTTSVTAGQVCPCSYPSRHAAAGAAATTYLSAVDPHRAARVPRGCRREIDWSRVYMAGHMPSDITGGALLGDMIGEYFAVTPPRRVRGVKPFLLLGDA